MSPFSPFWLFSYLFGVTNIKVWEWALGCCGSILITGFYIYLGTTIVDLKAYFDGTEELDSNMWYELVWPFIGVLFTVFGIRYSMKLTRKMIQELEEEEAREEEKQDLKRELQEMERL